MLDRSDLPDDRPTANRVIDVSGWEAHPERHPVSTGRGRLGVWVSVATAVLLVVTLVVGVWLTTSITQRNAGTTAAVIAGIPATLMAATLLVGLAIRRRHH
jgi:hypothetical protein